MDEEIPPALTVVLRDLHAQCVVRPRLEQHPELGLLLYAPDGSGQGVDLSMGATPEECLAGIADQVQDWAVEALWSEGESAVWPQCPAHPDAHPLTATVTDGTAMWVCPKSGTAFARIGRLEAGPGGLTAPGP
ncbi:hypothetical protein [Streptomyces sp. uw30]|uniref:hypothetical protein n=1 Tax=Streptomyces sp. uw30 TaxID=1828179 RepID=UPI00165118C5|nr:hypothetical protein [Streptomyces sp. uw30]